MLNTLIITANTGAKMLGVIFNLLENYAEEKVGEGTWKALLDGSGIGPKEYKTTEYYPDDEAVKLVVAAHEATGISVDAILEDFGEYIVPDLVRTYSAFLGKDWNTLDLLENVQKQIHNMLTIKNPNAKPPNIQCRRPASNYVIISYQSDRKMCSLAKGIIKGAAKIYEDDITINETQCVNKGDSKCVIEVSLQE